MVGRLHDGHRSAGLWSSWRVAVWHTADLGPRLLAGLVVGLALFLGACTGQDGSSGEGPAVEPVASEDAPRVFKAAWLIDAEAVGADGPGFPFRYVEIVDDRSGRYLVQSPNHLALQTPDGVVFCAAIFRSDPYCSSTERAENTPPVLSYPIQLLQGWGPTGLYDLASHRELALAALAEPNAWHHRFDVINDVKVECFKVTGDTSAARTGFEVCFTDDDLQLVFSVDMQGDLIYEIDLITYERQLDGDAFETGFDEYIEAKPSLEGQLITLFPEIPAARPTPTPDPG